MFGRWRKIRADRRRWAAAQSLSELGELMALWLEGDLSVWPGYAPGFGPDDETTDLIPTLVAANRAGFVTDQSQPGCDEIGFDGRRWQQWAAVSGLVADEQLLGRLTREAEARGLIVLVSHPVLGPYRSGVTATTVDGEHNTAFGDYLPPRILRQIWRGLNPTAMDAVVDAWQVTLIDPLAGDSVGVWAALDAAFAQHAATP